MKHIYIFYMGMVIGLLFGIFIIGLINMNKGEK